MIMLMIVARNFLPLRLYGYLFLDLRIRFPDSFDNLLNFCPFSAAYKCATQQYSEPMFQRMSEIADNHISQSLLNFMASMLFKLVSIKSLLVILALFKVPQRELF